LPGEPILNKRLVLSIDSRGAQERRRLMLQGAGLDAPTPIAVEGLSDREIRGQAMHLAALAIKACVVKMMDCYYLARRQRYEQAFDRFIDVEGIVLNSSLISKEPLALEHMRDPAYHLLHRARRHLKSGQADRAEQDIIDAFGFLIQRLPVRTPVPRDAEHLARTLDVWPDLPDEFNPYVERGKQLIVELPSESPTRALVLPRLDGGGRTTINMEGLETLAA
jgi:hypothetical protein